MRMPKPRRRSLLPVLAVAAALAAPLALPGVALADFDAGLAAYDAGDYARAAAEWQAAADAGDVAAMRNLGLLYLKGRGVPADRTQAERWFRAAAEAGLDRAQVNLAALLQDSDPEQARAWYERAAASGNPYASAALAAMDAAEEQAEGTAPADAAPVEPIAAPAEAPVEEAQAGEQTQPAAEAPAASAMPAAPEPAGAAPASSAAVPESSTEATPSTSAAPTPTPSTLTQPRETDGVMAHLGIYPDEVAAARGWRLLAEEAPALNGLQPYYMPGYLPQRGDIVRLYARGPRGRLIALCGQIKQARPDAECDLHRFYR